MPLFIRTLLLSLLLLAVLPARFSSSDSNPTLQEIETLTRHELEAVKSCDYEAFIKHGNRAFQTLMDRLTFEDLCLEESDNLKKGYELLHLGAINKTGMTLHLFKVDLHDDQEDLLATVSFSHGYVVGFDLN